MSEKLQRVEIDVKGLQKALSEGVYTPAQVEAIGTTLRVGLASSLMETVRNLSVKENKLTEMLNKLTDVIDSKVRIDEESGLLKDMDYDSLLKLFSSLHKAQLDLAEVKRRVFNGKDLFSVDPLSAQDRALMDLFKTVDTPEKKSKLKMFLKDLTGPGVAEDEGFGEDDFDEKV